LNYMDSAGTLSSLFKVFLSLETKDLYKKYNKLDHAFVSMQGEIGYGCSAMELFNFMFLFL